MSESLLFLAEELSRLTYDAQGCAQYAADLISQLGNQCAWAWIQSNLTGLITSFEQGNGMLPTFSDQLAADSRKWKVGPVEGDNCHDTCLRLGQWVLEEIWGAADPSHEPGNYDDLVAVERNYQAVLARFRGCRAPDVSSLMKALRREHTGVRARLHSRAKDAMVSDDGLSTAARRLWEQTPIQVFEQIRDRVCYAVNIVCKVHQQALAAPREETLANIAQERHEPLLRVIQEAQAVWFETPIRRYLVRPEGPVFLDNLEDRADGRISGSCYHDLAMAVAVGLMGRIDTSCTAGDFIREMRFLTAAGDFVGQRLANLISSVQCECQSGLARWRAEKTSAPLAHDLSLPDLPAVAGSIQASARLTAANPSPDPSEPIRGLPGWIGNPAVAPKTVWELADWLDEKLVDFITFPDRIPQYYQEQRIESPGVTRIKPRLSRNRVDEKRFSRYPTSMKTESLSITHERVDDIPLLLGFMQQLHFPDLLERHLGSHHLHRGLSNGWLTTVWLAFLLSNANHRKVSVQDWAGTHTHTLETLIGRPLRPVEFSDDRLSILLRRLHDADWSALEADLWQATCEVYEISYQCVRLDATTSFGYHTITPDGLLQRGHSKDHRPDLPQLKLMAAAAQPTSHLLACDIVPGQSADDPLYLPLIRRVRQQLRQHGLLYTGDCKMAALATRAELVAEKDYYLMPLPRTGDAADAIATWIEEAVQEKHPLHNLTRPNEKGKKEVFARAYEREREQSSVVSGQTVAWTERVQVIRSLELAKRQGKQLEERLREAAAELPTLTPAVGRGHKQYREEEALHSAVVEVLERHRVEGLLTVTWQREEQQQTRYRGSGRGGPGRPTYTTTKVRYAITAVQRNEAVIAATKARQGWRVQVTNLSKARWCLRETVLLYNGGWSVERDFHLLKDQPLGIQPLFVREDEQIVGLTRLLTIALRVLTSSELQVRSGLAEAEERLSGLYEGQPKRSTEHPTAARCLKAINRMEITVSRVAGGQHVQWHLTELPPLLKRILKLLYLSPTLYTCLTKQAA